MDDPPLHLHPVGLLSFLPSFPSLCDFLRISSFLLQLLLHFLLILSLNRNYHASSLLHVILCFLLPAVYLTGDPTVGPGLNLRWTQWIHLDSADSALQTEEHFCSTEAKNTMRRLHSHKIYMSTISNTKPSCREKTSDTSGTETSHLSQSARLSVHHLQNHDVFLLQQLFYCFNHTSSHHLNVICSYQSARAVSALSG